MIQKVVFKFILPLLIFAVVLGTIQSITDHSLDPRHDSLIDQLNEFNREVPIGKPDQHEEEEAEMVLRGVTTQNLLAAQNCLYPAIIYSEAREHDGEGLEALDPDVAQDLEDDEEDFLENLQAENRLWSDVVPEEANTREEHTVFSFGKNYPNQDENLIRYAVHETSFAGNCMGAEPIDLIKGDSWTDIVIPNLGLMGTNTGAVGCFVSNIACGVAVANWMAGQIGATAEDTILKEFEGHAAQGRFGQISFKMHENVTIKHNELFAMDLGWWARHQGGLDFSASLDDPLGLFKPGADTSPDFTRGGRSAAFIPDGIVTDDEAESHMDSEVESTKGVLGDNPARQARDQRTLAIGHLLEHDNDYDTLFSFDPDDWGADDERWVRRRLIMPYHHWDGDWIESINAFRVRMVDVPTFASSNMQDIPDFNSGQYRWSNSDSLGSFDSSNNPSQFTSDIEEILDHSDTDSDRRKFKNVFEYLVLNTDFHICEGVEGSIKSNAGGFDETGKPSASNLPGEELRDVAFPEIKIDWERSDITKEQCIEQHLEEEYGTTDYDVYEGDDPDLEWFDGEIIVPK